MGTLNGILDGARRALYTHQLALGVTGHNIDNVNTPGYHRQRANLRASEPLPSMPGQIGTGVETLSVERYRSDHLNRQITAENGLLGQAQMRSDGLALIETILMEPDDQGLSSTLDRFWNAWQDLANEPESLAPRRVLLDTAEQLVARIRTSSDRLAASRDDLDSRVPTLVSSINQKGQELAALNDRIQDSMSRGQQPNDLLDRRDALVDELSTMGSVSVSEEADGQLRVIFGNLPIVEGVHHHALAVTTGTDPAGGVVQQVVWARSGEALNTSSGELGALLELRDRTLPGYQDQLDHFTSGLVRGLNSVHRSGTDLDGRAGGLFFDPEGLTAATIGLALEPGRDEARLVASADGGVGNGELALRMSGLGDAILEELGGRSLNQVYGGLVVSIGQQASYAASELDAQTTFLGNLEEQRQSLTGVNLDEEMTAMLIQQQAYQAAGRVVATVDEMMQSLLALV
ncbi:MAG: flagellar hook-associated protein FlgK [Candidatus Delongbacteria bacterium]|nr:flagellar hook-associated protein FlgK [Candidatus Cloacimonadota bacterium]MCB9474014.1 flagellar hook-associated protein FlgK [Candidatus Delongbacteria bacterium]